MQVTNVRVSFLREKQPAQFEKSRPEVEFVATLDQGDDHVTTARQLMTDAATIVYAGLGYEVPERVATALASGKVPTELSVAANTTEAAPEDAEAAGGTNLTIRVKDVEDFKRQQADTIKPKARGRPKGSKNGQPKKETAAAKRKREDAEAREAADRAFENSDDGVPGDDPAPNISTGGERVNPNDDGVPGEDESPETEMTEFTPKDLHTLIMSHVDANPRTLSIANAKQVLAQFKVARAQDLTNEQALEGKAMVELMVKEMAGVG